MTFNLTRDQFEKCRRDMATEGVSLVGDSGTINQKGCVVDFNYAEPNLSVNVTRKPFFIPQSFVEGKINGWFTAETT